MSWFLSETNWYRLCTPQNVMPLGSRGISTRLHMCYTCFWTEHRYALLIPSKSVTNPLFVSFLFNRGSKKPVQYNASRSGSLDRSLHHPMVSTDYLNLHGHQVLPAQPMVQDPSMPLLTPPNPIDQLEEVKRRLEDECKAKSMRQR